MRPARRAARRPRRSGRGGRASGARRRGPTGRRAEPARQPSSGLGSTWSSSKSWMAISARKRGELPIWPQDLVGPDPRSIPLPRDARASRHLPRGSSIRRRRDSTRACGGDRAVCRAAARRCDPARRLAVQVPHRAASPGAVVAGQITIASASDGCACCSRPASSIGSVPSHVAGRSLGRISSRRTVIACSSVPVISRAASGSTRVASETTATSSTRYS
jgi:hypothetical protein